MKITGSNAGARSSLGRRVIMAAVVLAAVCASLLLWRSRASSRSPGVGAETRSARTADGRSDFSRNWPDPRRAAEFGSAAEGNAVSATEDNSASMARGVTRDQDPEASSLGTDVLTSARMGGFADKLPPLAKGNLAISGTVMEQAGAPLGEISVVLAARSFVHAPVITVSRIDGSFQFGDLPDGDYELRVEPTQRHFAATAAVRAGVTSALLVLRRKDAARTVRVQGMVVTTLRDPIAAVDVLPIGEKSRAQTDAAGRYDVELLLDKPGEVPAIRFRKEGFREQRISVTVPPNRENQILRADVVMEPIGDEGRVSGTVSAADKQPITGATLQLSSAQRRRNYRAGSDLDGRFEFPNVEVAPDYRLWVRPPPGYRDQVRDNLAITGRGLELNLVLEPVSKGSLEGRLMDPDGTPLAGFGLRLRTAASAGPTRVVGDAHGRFVVEDLPAGRLSLETESAPQLSVSGIEVSPGARQTVDITLDWGDYEITGEVQSVDGQPLSGSEVSLFWQRQAPGGITSQSSRKTITDQRGFFSFTRLGSGRHALSVLASGYHGAQREIDVARSGTNKLQVQLQRAVRR